MTLNKGDADKIELLKLIETEYSSVYLEDVLQPGKVWNKHRANSDKVASFYRNSENYDRYANRINLCSQFLNFELTGDRNEYKLKLSAARFCRVRYCPICQWRRSLKWKAKAFKVLPTIVEEYPTHRWLFLTLTAQNCRIEDLRSTIQKLNKAWQRMSQRKIFPGVGWLRSTEVTRSKDGSAHPHFHCLLMVKPSYFGKYYIKQQKWVELWKSCLRVDYEPVLDIRAIKREQNPVVLVPEILKYCVKESDLICDRQWFLELTNQMHSLRTVATGGILKEFVRQQEEDREYEVESEKYNGAGHLYFDWRCSAKKYQLFKIKSSKSDAQYKLRVANLTLNIN